MQRFIAKVDQVMGKDGGDCVEAFNGGGGDRCCGGAIDGNEVVLSPSGSFRGASTSMNAGPKDCARDAQR